MTDFPDTLQCAPPGRTRGDGGEVEVTSIERLGGGTSVVGVTWVLLHPCLPRRPGVQAGERKVSGLQVRGGPCLRPGFPVDLPEGLPSWSGVPSGRPHVPPEQYGPKVGRGSGTLSRSKPRLGDEGRQDGGPSKIREVRGGGTTTRQGGDEPPPPGPGRHWTRTPVEEPRGRCRDRRQTASSRALREDLRGGRRGTPLTRTRPH